MKKIILSIITSFLLILILITPVYADKTVNEKRISNNILIDFYL